MHAGVHLAVQITFEKDIASKQPLLQGRERDASFASFTAMSMSKGSEGTGPIKAVANNMLCCTEEWVVDPRQGIMYLNLFDACLVCLNVFELFLFPLLVAGIIQATRLCRSGVWKRAPGLESMLAWAHARGKQKWLWTFGWNQCMAFVPFKLSFYWGPAIEQLAGCEAHEDCAHLEDRQSFGGVSAVALAGALVAGTDGSYKLQVDDCWWVVACHSCAIMKSLKIITGQWFLNECAMTCPKKAGMFRRKDCKSTSLALLACGMHLNEIECARASMQLCYTYETSKKINVCFLADCLSMKSWPWELHLQNQPQRIENVRVCVCKCTHTFLRVSV